MRAAGCRLVDRRVKMVGKGLAKAESMQSFLMRMLCWLFMVNVISVLQVGVLSFGKENTQVVERSFGA